MANEHTLNILQAVVSGLFEAHRKSCTDMEQVIGWILQYGKVSEVTNMQARAMLETRLMDLLPQCKDIPCPTCGLSKRYQLQSRYQDSSWEVLHGESFSTVEQALDRARILCRNAIYYRMVRVMNLFDGSIVKTFPAGGERKEEI